MVRKGLRDCLRDVYSVNDKLLEQEHETQRSGNDAQERQDDAQIICDDPTAGFLDSVQRSGVLRALPEQHADMEDKP